MNTPTKGQEVTLQSDLMHYRDIFDNAQVENGVTSVALKAGAILVVDTILDNVPFAPDVECHTPNGAYYQIPVDQLAW